jgi:UV DNA damage endonuclease
MSTHKIRDWDKIRGNIRLGLCCINNKLRECKPPVFCSRTMIRKNFTVDKAKELSLQNVKDISELITWNEANNIKVLRLSSDIFPHFTDTETEKYTIDFAREELKKAGELANRLGHRILMHPGQYNQVGAKDEKVFQKTIEDLVHHAEILDAMGIDENGVLIVHGGGTYGDKKKTIKRWIEQYFLLPECVRKRLVIEHCERCYSVYDCLEISQQVSDKGGDLPVVFDTHHFSCYARLHPDEDTGRASEAVKRVIATWGKRKPVFHISNQGEGKIGHHSDYIDHFPKYLFDLAQSGVKFDLEVEAKAKEAAIFKLYEMYPLSFELKLAFK